VREALERLARRFGVESAIVFGSWSKGGGGEWSDVDVLVATEGVDILDRFYIAALKALISASSGAREGLRPRQALQEGQGLGEVGDGRGQLG